ncbi:glycosyltransferase [bacterium]|nr:MAG: glycosyltransferase [bacterium]
MLTEPLRGNPPRVSVITCAYNGERFLDQAIESILAQTYADFEYIVVDDASTDGSPAIIARYAGQDARLIALRNPVNLNPSGALNRALQVARGDYLAILDQDDLAYPERLARQVAFLDTHPEVGVIGAQVLILDPNGRPLRPMAFPTTTALSRWHILFGSPVLHSAAMMRRALVAQAGGYSEKQWYVNDYLLLATLLSSTAIANLPDTLTSYRRHDRQTVGIYNTPQRGQAWLLIYRMLVERLQLRVPLDDIGALYDGTRGSHLPNLEALRRAADLLAAIRNRYLEAERPDEQTIEQIDVDCARRWLAMAWVHRRGYRQASRAILRRALELDPQLWQRPRTRDLLRRLGRLGVRS